MSILKGVLESGNFAVTAELAPPKGSDLSTQLAAAEMLRGKVHGINVTDMQSACLQASALGLSIRLKQAGFEPILQLTGRDRNRMALMGDVLAAAGFGIDTILALTGDHPLVGDCPDSKSVYDLDSVGILQMLSTMEQTGCDCGGNPLTGSTPSLYKGACATPLYDPLFLQINKLRHKVDAGAMFVQTQAIFEIDVLKRFMEQVDKAGIQVYILAGIIPLKSAAGARNMNENLPGICIPQTMIDRLEAAEAKAKATGNPELPAQLGRQMAAQLIAQIQEEKLCHGVHIMPIGMPKNIPAVLEMAGIAL